jgi:hypothetical protein
MADPGEGVPAEQEATTPGHHGPGSGGSPPAGVWGLGPQEK